jgi:tetratricopeptide (TPR) repeat protein
MKNTSLKLLIASSLLVVPSWAQNRTKKPAAKPAQRTVARPAARSTPAKTQPSMIKSNQRSPVTGSASQRQLAEALSMVRSGQYQQAAPLLYSLSRRTDLTAERMQIKYILGVALSELKLYQTAAFQFVDVIRNGGSRYVRQSIERLSIAADALGDDTLLNYAISKVKIDEFPENQKDVIYYRLGEIKLRNGQFGEAVNLFSRVSPSSRYAANAKFNRGLALLESNRPAEALALFQSLNQNRSNASVTDVNRVASQMAIARTYYQMQEWDKAIDAYREIPRDSEYWHNALFELSWANLRAAKFRSTLSNLQSLHSAFYEDNYIPESLLVRAIVYLYICKFDETEKTLGLFEKTYGPVRSSITRFLETNRDPMAYFAEAERAYYIRKDKKPNQGMKIPYMAARAVLDEGNVKRAFQYLKSLNDEKARIDSMPSVARSPLGVYATKVLANRFKNSKVSTGELVKAHLQNMKTDLNDFFEQAGFIRYEMINGKKEILKKKIAGKDIPKAAIDEKVDRVFYVQNGYEYWPFDGEYWLDEIGNYHYLGQQSCE